MRAGTDRAQCWSRDLPSEGPSLRRADVLLSEPGRGSERGLQGVSSAEFLQHCWRWPQAVYSPLTHHPLTCLRRPGCLAFHLALPLPPRGTVGQPTLAIFNLSGAESE